MNHSIHSADRSTHLKIVIVALVAGIAVAASVIQRRSAQVVCIVGGLSCYLAVLGWLVTH